MLYSSSNKPTTVFIYECYRLCSPSSDELQSGSWFEQRDNNLAHILALEEVFHTECNLFQAAQTAIVNLDNELAWWQGFNHLSHVLLEMAGIGRHEETGNGTRSGKKLKGVHLVTLNTLLRVISRNGTNDQQTSFRGQTANGTLAFNAGQASISISIIITYLRRHVLKKSPPTLSNTISTPLGYSFRKTFAKSSFL